MEPSCSVYECADVLAVQSGNCPFLVALLRHDHSIEIGLQPQPIIDVYPQWGKQYEPNVLLDEVADFVQSYSIIILNLFIIDQLTPYPSACKINCEHKIVSENP